MLIIYVNAPYLSAYFLHMHTQYIIKLPPDYKV